MLIQLWFKPAAETRPNSGQFELVEVFYDDFSAACDAISSGALITATFIHTRQGEIGTRVVQRRIEGAFRGTAVDRVQVPSWVLVEASSA